MRIGSFMRILAVVAVGAAMGPARAQEAFDACEVFTLDDAQKLLGKEVTAEPLNPKVKKPKVIPTCTYYASKDGAKLTASASFKWGKTNEDTQRAFEDARMQHQTKPMLISGAEAFWAGKLGEMMIKKGRTWVTLTVGPAQPSQRDINAARTFAEILVKKL
jgi:hypothetical protein